MARLNCLLHSDGGLFVMENVDANMTVDSLKKAIKAKLSPLLGYAAPYQLTLWKVCPFYCQHRRFSLSLPSWSYQLKQPTVLKDEEEEEAAIRELRRSELSTLADKLRPLIDIGSHFPQLSDPNSSVHIIVEPPKLPWGSRWVCHNGPP